MAKPTTEVVAFRNLKALKLWERNYREGDVGAIIQSIARFGFNGAIRVWHDTVCAGNHSKLALEAMKASAYDPPRNIRVVDGDWYVPTIDVSHLSKAEAEAFAVSDNHTQELGSQDPLALVTLLEQFHSEADGLLEATGYSTDDIDALLREQGPGVVSDTQEQARQTLAERFIVPPFSVLDARQGYWQARKRAWIALGIQSELGRGAQLLPVAPNEDDLLSKKYRNRAAPGGSLRPATSLKNGKTQRGDGVGRPISDNGLLGFSQQARSHYKNKEAATAYQSQPRLTALQKTGSSAVVYGTAGNISEQTGTSIFDPVLCELAYRWFCPPRGAILDPFAGGSVRGIVAALLDRQYTGVDLRPEQVAANEAQAAEIVPDNAPRWVVGDSRNMSDLLPDEYYDFVFTCPPYFDLEIYSDDASDLSNAGDYEAFLTDYRAIIAASIERLQDNRFCGVVVGDIRDKRGIYRNFVSDTIAAFQDAGAMLYNEAILVTAAGSLPIRARRPFESARKLGKTHQNVLVFVKGDPSKATEACGYVDVEWPIEESAPEGALDYT